MKENGFTLEKADEIPHKVLLGRVSNCLDVHLGQIVRDKGGVVDWCIVLV